MTMKCAEEFLSTRGGLWLFHRRWEADSPRAVCLLVHGIGEHSGRYEELALALTERRFSVWAVDHYGHGRSEGRRGDCRALSQFVEELKVLAEEARSQAPGLPHVVVGHSLGGLVALSYASEFPDAVRAVAVSSPALKLAHAPSALKAAVVRGMARVIPVFPFPNGVKPSLLSHDPRVVKAYESDPLVHRVLTARCATALDQAIRGSFALATALKVPCLILQAGDDEICDPQASAQFAQSVKEASVTFRRYEGMYHELFNEIDRAQVISDLCEWLEQILG